MIADGRSVAKKILQRLAGSLSGKRVCFALFSEDLASKQFIQRKRVVAEEIGVEAVIFEYPQLPEKEIIEVVTKLASCDYDGIVVQLPLPDGVNTERVLDLIPVEKDMDVLSERARVSYASATSLKVPPVARAVKEVLEYYNISLVDKNVLVIGKGKLVGGPVSAMLTREKIRHSVIEKETPLDVQKQLIASADVIISGAGVPHLIQPDMIKESVVLIDAGTSEDRGRLVGDVNPLCESKASFITPVPGGVGPVTVACLFLNL